MDSFNDVFLAAKRYCKENMIAQSYDIFIKPIEKASMSGDTVTVYTPTVFIKNVILDRFADLFSKAFESVLGFTMIVKFEVEDEFSPSVTSSQYDVLPGDYEPTFDTFIVGSSNKFAHAAAVAVAQNPAGAYNPLFIYGASGLGKTHLLHAIRLEIKKNHPEFNIVYVDGETFTNEIIAAIRDNKTAEFQAKYRKTDVLLVDDIQFIAGKTSTQEEFFHTFNALHNAHKQIVLVSDRSPKEIKSLEERLRTRFEWGLMADIQPPDFETRCAIIKRKRSRMGLDLKNDVVEFISNNVQANIRQLEGVVKKLHALQQYEGKAPVRATAQAAIKDILNEQLSTPVTVEKILSESARVFNCSVRDIKGNGRKREVSLARQTSAYVIKEVCDMTHKEIGDVLSGKDHSTIVYMLKQVATKMEAEPSYKNIVDDIIKNVKTL